MELQNIRKSSYLHCNSFFSRKAIYFIFATVLLFQLVISLCFGFQKKSYHIDEIYSYILSNSYDTDRISHADELWNTWINGDQLDKFVTVQKGERFAYDRVYHNNSLDAHPPCITSYFTQFVLFFPIYSAFGWEQS